MSILPISYVKLSKTTWRQNLRFLFEKKNVDGKAFYLHPVSNPLKFELFV